MTLLHHWHQLGWIGLVVAVVVALQVFLPGVLPLVLRWLIGTETGRCLVIVVAVAIGWWSFRGHYLAAGRAGLLAEQRQEAARQAIGQAFATLDAYMAGAAAMADIEKQSETEHAQALAAKDRTIADLRRGAKRLRDEWACPAMPSAPALATAAFGGDAYTERRFKAAGAVVQVGDDADADLRACQRTLTSYQQIGVLKVPQ